MTNSISNSDNHQQDEQQRLNKLLSRVAEFQDREAFAEIFHLSTGRIYQFGLKRFQHSQMAKELVQETMMTVWHKAALYNASRGDAGGWIYTIMRNQCFDMLRKMQSNREDCISYDIWPLYENKVEESPIDWQQSHELKNKIQQLPQEQRHIIDGIYLQGLTQQELAERLDLPLGTIKSRLRLGLSRLRKELSYGLN
ncbi:sigma-70 family RNA polymerase sigma factor [Vibrio sp. SS-MA-C1-2]|uniref:sigma-70 family RNA polymerase sigma factor n=1 Tax=Vibrio sp. SS-MA-C1-2 TaxID=2908646 RepID=UPI001F3DEB94|nr:sigma-70 family RNA polymerase sigma factor [Vibrio sp. SS-MA-C1-2]UJF18367.1 sigma-70 family RNA polymerase sigma factor [Vibrio sp. SS-MA-C1-2]